MRRKNARPSVGMVCGLRTAIMAEPNKIAITTEEVISTWACTWKPPSFLFANPKADFHTGYIV